MKTPLLALLFTTVALGQTTTTTITYRESTVEQFSVARTGGKVSLSCVDSGTSKQLEIDVADNRIYALSIGNDADPLSGFLCVVSRKELSGQIDPPALPAGEVEVECSVGTGTVCLPRHRCPADDVACVPVGQ